MNKQYELLAEDGLCCCREQVGMAKFEQPLLSNDQLKTNGVQTFKSRAQPKETKIVFRTV
ncbi:MAG: hypothetical protein HQL44_15305 [Alphaproteobacteria bacterium]|nr:hypothetical protein [Alphaproteobacteria bacterium]